MKKLIWILLCSICWAQQPSTGGDSTHYPLWGANSKWSNGVAIGYYPTKGSGLTLNVGSGTANCAGTRVAYAGGTLTMTNNTTNYVFLNASSSCAPASNTSGYPSYFWIAIVVTSGGSISSITDDRNLFFGANLLKVNASTITLSDTVNFNDTTPTAGSNGLNVKWQKSTSAGTTSVSAYVPGDGTATHCLLGTGAFGTCLVAVGGSPGDIQYNNGGVLGGFADGTIDQVLHGTKVFKSVPDCDDTGGQHLNYDTGTHAYSCGTSGGSGGGVHSCMIVVGADNATSTVVNADLGPQNNICQINSASTITEVSIAVDNASSTTSVQVRKRSGGSTTNLLSGALATSSSANTAKCARTTTSATCYDGSTSSSSITVSTTSIAAGDWLELTSGTADGTTKRASVVISWTTP